ncbi:MAG: lytic transglycosylase domain-containing protein [Rhodospirillales bacterium]|nr:lytic transglycosylase domain-containing protein [Rhodospirillales bacterium]
MRQARLVSLSAVLSIVLLSGPAHAQHALSDGDNVLYRQAFAAAYADRWSEVASLAQQARDHTLAKVLRWMELKDTNRHNDFVSLARFLIQNPEWPSQITLRKRAEEAIPDELAARDVVTFFDLYPPQTDDGMQRYIAALISLNRDNDARDEINRAWAGRDFALAKEEDFLSDHGVLLTADQHWQRIDRLIWEGKTTAARRILHLVDNDRQLLAKARIALRGNAAGVDAAINAVPAHLQDNPGLIYERIRWRRAHGRLAGTLALLMVAPGDLPYPDLWAAQRLDLAEMFMDDGEYLAAYRVLAGHYEQSGALHYKVDWLAGWLALRKLNDPAAALDHFTTFHGQVNFPISKARGAYWAGRAAEEIGDPGLAAVWYDLAAGNGQTFYGQLGADKIGVAPRLPDPPNISEAEIQAFADDELTTVVRQLHEIGEENLVRIFLLRMTDATSSGPRHRLIGQLALVLNRPDLTVMVAKRAVKAGTVLVTAGYPVIALPAGTDVDPALALSIIRQESVFNPGAISPAGAHGLMQLMLPTAREIAGELGVSTSANKLLSDPQHNMLLGMTYIDKMLDRNDGSFVKAIAAYNAGPGRVRQWVAERGDPHAPGIDIVDWIEEIPFSETQNYVQRVIEGMRVYRMLSGTQVPDSRRACISGC